MGRASLLLVLVLPALAARADEPVVRRFDSAFGAIFVVDEGGERSLRFGAPDAADQSVIDLEDPRRAPVAYVRAAALGALYAPRVERAILVGLGAGVLSRALLALMPWGRLDSVELNPVVVELARSEFGLRPHPRHFVHIDDGAAFLRDVERADLIVLDAYQGDDLPGALSTPDFFARTALRLSPRGVVVMNLAVEDEALERRMIARFDAAFAGCEAVRVDEGNLVLFGGAAPADADALRARAASSDARGALAWPLLPFVDALQPCEEVEAAP